MSEITRDVEINNEGRVIRGFLKEEMGLSTRFIRAAAKEGRIKVGGSRVKMDYTLKAGDHITVILTKDESQDIAPEDIPLDIAFENESVLVVNKPPFMVCHPTRSHGSGTLANGVINYFQNREDASIVRLVSRLDMNTSGLVTIAKNQYVHMSLSKAMADGSFKKKYLALVKGRPMEDEGTIDLPIYRPAEDSIKRVVDERGQTSITHYKVLESSGAITLVELTLETGRTHQIRVHLSHIGHPILGDTLYGQEDKELIGRQALHAYYVEFPDPKTSQLITITSSLPEDMHRLKSGLNS